MSKFLGRFVVSDPAVCHGLPTFRGTRVFVGDVLDDVARGMAWEAIIERWHRSISVGSGEVLRPERALVSLPKGGERHNLVQPEAMPVRLTDLSVNLHRARHIALARNRIV